MKIGVDSYKNKEKKQTNIFNDLSYFQNLQYDPNLFQQQYINQFYLSNGYINPYTLQFYSQLINQSNNINNINQNIFNQNMISLNIGNLNQKSNQPVLNLQFQGQELNQLFGNLDLLQIKEAIIII